MPSHEEVAHLTSVDPVLSQSPHNPRSPDYTVTIIGGGLAGLSAAINTIDEVYKKLEYHLKIVSTELGVGSTQDVITFVKKLKPEQKRELIRGIPGLSTTLDAVHNLRVNIIDKEPKLGGNSMKASSGINAVDSLRQRTWETLTESPETDTLDLFIRDTVRSAISPEPPLWVDPSDPSNTDSVSPLVLSDFLSPISAFTPGLISSIASASAEAVPFLETPSSNQRFGTVLMDFADAFDVKMTPIHFSPSTVNGKPYSPPRPLFLSKLTRLGGHSAPRTHRPGPADISQPNKFPEPPVGAGVIAELQHRLTTFPYSTHVQVICGVQAVSLNTKADPDPSTDADADEENQSPPPTVSGVVYRVLPSYNFQRDKRLALDEGSLHGEQDIGRLFTLHSSAVIITSGGYSASRELIQAFSPQLGALDLPTTNGPWATGDAFSFTKDLSPGLVGTAALQVHPTSFVNPSEPQSKVNFLAPEALRGVGGILLNSSGARFVNELSTRDHVSRSIYWQPHRFSFIVLSHTAAMEFGGAINFYASKGIFAKSANSPSSLHLALKNYFGETLDGLSSFLSALPADTASSSPILSAHGVSLAFPLQYVQSIALALTMLQLGSAKDQTSPTTPDRLASLVLSVHETLKEYSSSEQDSMYQRAVKRHYQSFHPTPIDASSEEWGQLYVAMVTPALHYSMGGICSDAKGRVLTKQYHDKSKAALHDFIASNVDLTLKPESHQFVEKFTSLFKQFQTIQESEDDSQSYIPGLYVAGEASGGFHGRNRLGGNSLLECVAMGRIASREAVNQMYMRP